MPLVMNALSDLFRPGHVVTLKAPDKSAVLADLARRVAAAAGVSQASVAEALAAREALGSTGVGHGIAVPHARLPGIAETVGFFARLARPIDWRAIDSRPVDLVFAMLSPAEEPGGHLSLLATVTRRLRDPATAAAIRAAADAGAIAGVLTA